MRKKIEKTAVLDVGGTFVKHALFMEGSIVPDSRQTTAINEKANADEIMDVFAACAGHADYVSVCMPGPMNYAKGQSLMKHKFHALYGVEMKNVLEKKTGASWTFAHDVVSFLAGVLSLGEGENANVPAAVTLGTGLGYAFAKGTSIQMNELGSPEHPLWNQAFREGIVEDHASAKGISKQYKKLTGRQLTALEISQLAHMGEKEAQIVFADMGYILGDMLEKRVIEDGIDLVILGGQVSRSADLFLPQMQSRMRIPVRITSELNDAPLYGAFELCAQQQ